MAKKSRSRPARWADAAARAAAALGELEELKIEYEEWYDGLPENLANSALGEKLQAVVDLDIESAVSTVSDAEGIDLPRGFGRD